MTNMIRPLVGGGLGSGAVRVLKVAYHGPTDLLLHKFRHAPSIELAREAVISAGRARAKVPSYVPVSPPMVIDEVLSILGEDWESPLAAELEELADEAEAGGVEEVFENRLGRMEKAIAKIPEADGPHPEFDQSLENFAEELGRETSGDLYSPRVTCIFTSDLVSKTESLECQPLKVRARLERRCRDLQSRARFERCCRDRERSDAIDASEELRTERVAAGLPPFEEYEVDALTGRQMPSPEEVADLIAIELEIKERAETDAAYRREQEAQTPREPDTVTLDVSQEPARNPSNVPLDKSSRRQISAAVVREIEMEDLTRVPGLVGEIVDWMDASNLNPNRTLAFAGALALIGTLAGRLYKTPTGLRTNIYALGLAPSGFGKDHVRSCINVLSERSGCGEWLGSSEIMSGSGIRRRIEDHPSTLYVIDEFGHLMRKMCDDRNACHAQIRSLFLQYFESAGDVFRGADYAGERGTPVYNPNVSFYGVSNPGTFWSACQGSATIDGLLARIMPFAVGSTEPVEGRPSVDKDEPPEALLGSLRDLTRARVGGNLNGRLTGGSAQVRALVVNYGPGAEDAFFDAKRAWKKAAYDKRGRPEESIFARVVENALKVAMIIAIGVDADRPIITVERLQHGLAIAKHCAETTLREIKGRLADNDRQREYVDALRMITEAGHAGISRTNLLKRINGRFTERRLNEILQSLEGGSKEIVSKFRPTKGRPAMRFIAVENLGPDEVEG